MIVLLTALPIHFYLAAYDAVIAAGGNPVKAVGNQPQNPIQWWVSVWLIAGTIGSLLIGSLATYLPMRIGLRAFRKMEF